MPGSLTSPSCNEHNGKECVCWCQTCGKAACIYCVTKSHQNHRFTELETVLQEKRTNMQKELNNLESNVLIEWQDLMKEAKKFTSEFLGQVNGIEKELDKRAEEFHRRVEEIKENYKKQLNEMKTSNLAILHEQEKRVSDGLEKVKQEIKECEERLRSSDMESLLEHEDAEVDKKNTLPTISQVTPPVLTPSWIDTEELTEMFGQLIIRKTNKGDDTTQSAAAVHGRPVQASHIHTDTKTRGPTTQIKPLKQLIPKPLVQSEFDTEISEPSLTCVGSGCAWVETDERIIQLVDSNGIVKDTICIDFDFNDMALSPQGDLLLCDTDNKCIKSISANKKVQTLFRLLSYPYGPCCLHSGHIAVTIRSECRVVIYSMSGKVIKELDKKLFRDPYLVAQNKVNSNLYINDNDKVLALDKDYKVRYEYKGQGNRESFLPRGLCTDNTGHVLITDSDNQRVDILDQDGVFLQYLLTEEQGLVKPWSIDVDSEGKAWVGEELGRVKVVKYLQ